MELTDQEKLKRLLREHKGPIPEAPDGPRIEEFHALSLAQAIECEVARCGVMGWSKVTLHMTIDDAMRLAAHLRR